MSFIGEGGNELDALYRNLMKDLKSIRMTQNKCKCLIRFHNCTPHRIIPFWIDFNGLPIKYSVLARGTSLNMDTYASHLWFFKVDNSNRTPLKILALAEEAINWSIDTRHFKSNYIDKTNESPEQNSSHDSMAGLICAICRFLSQEHSLAPAKIPCSHLTGEAKFSVSDLHENKWTNYNNSYIYSCPVNNHPADHSIRRRNIYLVEPFYNLRERCFLAIANNIRHSDLLELKLPSSLQVDYFRFMTTLKKMDEYDRND